MPAARYKFADLGDVSCAEIVRTHPQLLVGFRAVNTSWDSGLLSRGDWPSADDWPSVNGYACSPPITVEMLQDWPISHDDFCDEWWIFESAIPNDFQVTAFCNFIMPIAQYKELDYEGGCRLDDYLARFQPIAMFGSSECGYLVQRT